MASEVQQGDVGTRDQGLGTEGPEIGEVRAMGWNRGVCVFRKTGVDVFPEASIMQNFLYDLRYAVRQLRNTPGMAVLAILTLALGVGANTAIFTVIDSVLLRPLPYAHSDRLVFIGPGGDKPPLDRPRG